MKKESKKELADIMSQIAVLRNLADVIGSAESLATKRSLLGRCFICHGDHHDYHQRQGNLRRRALRRAIYLKVLRIENDELVAFEFQEIPGSGEIRINPKKSVNEWNFGDSGPWSMISDRAFLASWSKLNHSFNEMTP